MTKLSKKRCLPWINEHLALYLNVAFWFLIAALDLRLLEIILCTVSKGHLGIHILNNFYGLFMDVLTFVRYSLVIFPIFLIISAVSSKIAVWFLRIIFSISILASIALIYYYITAGIPLDRVFIMYSLNDIINITHSSKSMAWWEYAVLFGFPILFLFVSGKKIKLPKITKYIFLVVFALSFVVRDVPSKLYKSHISYYDISNKLDYFLKSIICNDDIPTIDLENISEEVLTFQSFFPDNEFVGTKYPFLHTDKTPDVLSDFFELTEKPPNIVLVIVEGMGRMICGENSVFPSATLFLDSLASEGLYWENCFSSSQRTLNVLPTIFGALPMGERGFMDAKNNAPEFQSFPLIFKENGYHSSFFYGGWLSDDDMNFFVPLNKFDNYVDENLRFILTEQQNWWGLFDHVLFEEAIKTLDFSNDNARLDVYLTLTTHAPYEFPNLDDYLKKYQNIIRKQNKYKIDSKNSFLPQASYMYLDESLRHLVNMYKEKEGFDNTIFIITGDHNYTMPEDYWRVCHVPLIIWSPMIKEAKKFSAMVSHRDIAPSLLSLMKNNFNFNSPQNATWLNTGLDTLSSFRSKTFTPQFNTARNFANIIYNDKFISKNAVYGFSYDGKNLSANEISKDSSLINFFNLYQQIDKYIMQNDLLYENKYHSQRYNTKTIYNISETADVLKYYKKATKVKPETLHEKENTVFCSGDEEFPFKVLEYEIKDDDAEIIKLSYGFSMYAVNSTVDHIKEKSIFLVTEITDKNNQRKCKSNDLIMNIYSYNKYDQWESFSFDVSLKKSNYSYAEGDKLSVYVWNKNFKEFYLSDFYLKLDVSK